MLGDSPALLFISCKMRGLLVTIPEPRGRKSLHDRTRIRAIVPMYTDISNMGGFMLTGRRNFRERNSFQRSGLLPLLSEVGQ